MHRAYLDEAGISKSEQFLVVAGVIVDTDEKWRSARSAIESLADQLVPRPKRKGFVFHAKEIYHGEGGSAFDRATHSHADRVGLVRRVVSIVDELNLPVVFSCVHKGRYEEKARTEYPNLKPKDLAGNCQAFAFGMCATLVETYMREIAGPSELACLIVEDNDHARTLIREVQDRLRNEDMRVLFPPALTRYFPVSRIVDEVTFARKTSSPLLQIADACAFALKRYFDGARHGEELAQAIPGVPSIVMDWAEDRLSTGGLLGKWSEEQLANRGRELR
ncbi:MAG: DUF3800 domain-containing protein [Proteobacteria bacterium]|nr:DUF3800 domain-containing protein [Pseudomonadota bacterium]